MSSAAAAQNALIGVFRQDLLEPVARVMQQLGARHVMAVHSEDGMDEISVTAATHVAELKDGEINSFQITPEQFDIPRGDLSEIVVNNADESLQLMQQVLDNHPGTARNIVTLNAGAAIYVAGLSADLSAGIDLADKVIADGSARQKLQDLIRLSNDPGA